MWDVFLQTSLIIYILMTVLWIVSVIIRNVSIVDLFWGLGYVIVNAIYFFRLDDMNTRQMIVLILVTIWGLRLTIYLFLRNIGKGEDFRYQNFRKSYGAENYWWISYFQTFLLQGALIMIISLPLLGVNTDKHFQGLSWLDYLGIAVWIIGFSFEAGGDYQLSQFKNNPSNKGKVLDKGFWKYTRHPNYFGDSAVWWAYGIFSLANGSYWHVLGSVIMTLLIIKVSGVSLLEKTLNNTKPQYKEYIEKTSAFFPWFPKE